MKTKKKVTLDNMSSHAPLEVRSPLYDSRSLVLSQAPRCPNAVRALGEWRHISTQYNATTGEIIGEPTSKQSTCPVANIRDASRRFQAFVR